jgi:hypothetical protein
MWNAEIGLGDDGVAEQEDVEVERSRAPPLAPLPAVLTLDRKAVLQQLTRR